MYIVLPYDKTDVKNVLDNLNYKKWKETLESMDAKTKISVKIPLFEIENKLNISRALKELGLEKTFCETLSNELKIKDVLHHAKISVTEKGTEAGAVSIEIGYGSAGTKPEIIDFIADHPFIYVIADKTSDLILLNGIYTGKK